LNVARRRLRNQRIAGPKFENAVDVVRWLGAVQAQDYLGSLWAVGLRLRTGTEAAVERAIADRSIVRTWPMRGTIHLVAAEDVRWMLPLMTPRVIAGHARRLQREFELDDPVLARSRAALIRALQGGRQLTRNETYQILEAARVPAGGQRGLHILWRLAQEGLICFGPRAGKQPTFVLLEEWVPAARRLGRDEALADLTRRYFTSHGPATVPDFMWWSGLLATDAAAGLGMAQEHLRKEVVGSRTYWLSSSAPVARIPSGAAYLLPAFDEYTVAYRDRSAVLSPLYAKRADAGHGIAPTMMIEGQVVGTWKRRLSEGSVIVTPKPFTRLKRAETQALAAAARRYGAFLGRPAVLAYRPRSAS
jgi:hypothetical protein